MSTEETRTIEDHKKIHLDLHTNLDKLVADWIDETGMVPSEQSILALMNWSHRQTINPSDRRKQFKA